MGLHASSCGNVRDRNVEFPKLHTLMLRSTYILTENCLPESEFCGTASWWGNECDHNVVFSQIACSNAEMCNNRKLSTGICLVLDRVS